jgi:hypothetical protein
MSESNLQKGSLVWSNEEKTAVKFDPNENGNWYVMGIDPYRKAKWWQKLLSFFKIYKTNKGSISVFRKNEDGTIENLNRHKL